MRFEVNQHMKLSQQMKLAPRMIQSMEILQMPMLALQERIEQELESNIALEQAEPGDRSEQESPEEDDRVEEQLDRRELVVGDESPGSADDWRRLSAMESTYGEAFDNEYSSQRYSPARMGGERDRKLDAMAGIPARGESITEQLLRQFSFAEVEDDVRAAGERMIGYVDSDGHLGADLETILDQNRNVPGMEMSLELLERTLRELQHWLDPPGIAARDHCECFLLQIDRREPGKEEEQQGWEDLRLLLKEHYEDLLENRLPRIAQSSELSMPRIHEAVRLMRQLTLHPGRELVDEEVPPIIPDVIIEYDDQADEYLARLTGGFLPPLRVSRQYAEMARDRSLDKETRQFVGNNVRNATWLIESIRQRKSTLLRVVNVVLGRQRDFFDHGPQHLKPLPMLEVADQLGIHVGTVSRAVADKWMQTPRGLVSLRKFFSGGTATDTGRDMSWEAVKATLQEIIEAEDKTRPLSDEALAKELKNRGIEIARRTVVKYRQQLGIPPARRRKQY